MLGATVPERWGGSGLTPLQLAACAEEIGRACAPVPTLASTYLATEAMLMGDSDALREQWLPGLAQGTVIGSVALTAGTLRCSAGQVTGRLQRVAAGAAATFVIAACDGVLLCIDLAGHGVARRDLRVLDPGAPLADIDLDGAPAAVLGDARALDTLLDRAAAFLAFEQLGGADRALEMARHYALQRRTFGRVVASYQAIKHKLADMWVMNELARGHAYHAAWALAHSPQSLPAGRSRRRVAASAAFEQASQRTCRCTAVSATPGKPTATRCTSGRCPPHWRWVRRRSGSAASSSTWPRHAEVTMDFDDTPAEAAFRAEVRAWLAANAEPKRHARDFVGDGLPPHERLAAARAWQARKAAAGYAAVTWPRELGGLAAPRCSN